MTALVDSNEMNGFEQMFTDLDSFTDCFNFDELNDPIQTVNNLFELTENFNDSESNFLLNDSSVSPGYSTHSSELTVLPSLSTSSSDSNDSIQQAQTQNNTINSNSKPTIEPLTIVLKNNKDQMTVTSEIILNFDQINDENCLKLIEKEIESVKETFKVLIDKKETVLDLQNNKISDDEEEESSDEMDHTNTVN